MNHPLVRRKFLATFSPESAARGNAGNVEGCRRSPDGVHGAVLFFCPRSLLSDLSPTSSFPFPLFPRLHARESKREREPVFSFFTHSASFSPAFLLRSPPPSPLFFPLLSFFCLLRSHRHPFPSHFLSPSPSFRLEIGLGVGMDIGSIRALPWATITCNTVGLSGPMGTRWGVLHS